ncbi:hypothetical protein ACRAWF_24005 [Streptomyces sp. L7]
MTETTETHYKTPAAARGTARPHPAAPRCRPRLLLVGGIATIASHVPELDLDPPTSPATSPTTVTPAASRSSPSSQGVLTALFALASYGVRRGLGLWLLPARNNAPLVLTALGSAAATWYTVLTIAGELGGIVNWEPGTYIAAVASLLPGHPAPSPSRRTPTMAPRKRSRRTSPNPDRIPSPPAHRPLDPATRHHDHRRPHALTVFAYGAGQTQRTNSSSASLIVVVFTSLGPAHRRPLPGRFRKPPHRQQPAASPSPRASSRRSPSRSPGPTTTTPTSASSILIFGTVALGLNIVVGPRRTPRPRLRRLPRRRAPTPPPWSPAPSSPSSRRRPVPFWAAALAAPPPAWSSASSSAPPPCRLRGDYLAIVTLGFGGGSSAA